MCPGNGNSSAPSLSDESDELSQFPGIIRSTVGGVFRGLRVSLNVDDVFQSYSDESEELSLVWRI